MISIFGFQDEFYIIIDNLNPIEMMPSTLPQGPEVLVLEHTMHCFVVDTTAMRFSVGVIVPVVVVDDYDTVPPSEFALFELYLLLFFLLFFTGEKRTAIFSRPAGT